MDYIIEPILARLKESVPELNFIDIDLGQLQLPDPPVDWPCALVDAFHVQYSSNGRGSQMALTTVTVRLGFNLYGPSDVDAADSLRQQALEHYDVYKKVCKALHGFSTTEFSPLERKSADRVGETYPRHYLITFETQSVENLKPERRKIEVPGNIRVKIEHPS